MPIKQLLHVGCGPRGTLPREFAAYKEIRLDANPAMEPDIVASIVAMPMVEEESFDALFASHVLEHLYPHEAAMALKEFLRVLKPEGKVVIKVPDLQGVGGKIALDEADQVLYQSPMGPIRALDILYGHQASVAGGNLFMAHKTGFTQGVLKKALLGAGFEKVEVNRDVKLELEARAFKAAQVSVNEDIDVVEESAP